MGSYGTRSWTYDANGNRTSETANSVVNTYAYPLTNNRLMSVKQGTVTTRAFTHDAAGNVVQDLRGANVYNYAVNNAGRIKWVTGAGTASYLYDGFQKLRYKSQGGAVTNYVWDSFRPHHRRDHRQLSPANISGSATRRWPSTRARRSPTSTRIISTARWR